MKLYLVALMPPSNIQKALGEIQVRAFQTGSGGELRALPPHIPLGFYHNLPKQPDRRTTIQESPLVCSTFVAKERYSYLDFKPATEISRLSDLIPGNAAEPLYPLGGVPIGLLGSPDATPPTLSFKSSTVSCYVLDWADGREWWESLTYEECWRAKAKRKIAGKG